jgi:hypothetical protein
MEQNLRRRVAALVVAVLVSILAAALGYPVTGDHLCTDQGEMPVP